MYRTMAVVIPSLNPNEKLVIYVHQLIAQGFHHIYVVNDGSSAEYDNIFRQLDALTQCTVLVHPHNRGKGAALKTAFAHIETVLPECYGIITVDSDGQHAVKDVCRLADKLCASEGTLWMGGRNFSQSDVPFKSWLGNRLSSIFFFLLHRIWVADTQTGLRGFHVSLLDEMRQTLGDKFEYEMAVLVRCANQKIPVQSISIDTIYIDGNVHSHFRPIRDSLRVARVLLGRPARFFTASGLSFLTDITLCWGWMYGLAGVIESDLLRVGLSVVLARIGSMMVNFTLNKEMVFRSHARTSGAFLRYCILAAVNMAVLTISICLGHRWLGIDERTLSVMTAIALFFVNYQIQQIWVFPETEAGGAV